MPLTHDDTPSLLSEVAAHKRCISGISRKINFKIEFYAAIMEFKAD